MGLKFNVQIRDFVPGHGVEHCVSIIVKLPPEFDSNALARGTRRLLPAIQRFNLMSSTHDRSATPHVITGDCDFADVNTNAFMDVHRCFIWIHFGAIPWHIGMFWYIRCYGIQLAP